MNIQLIQGEFRLEKEKYSHCKKRLFELRKSINSKTNSVKVEAIIKIE
jgi:hypothetical protein